MTSLKKKSRAWFFTRDNASLELVEQFVNTFGDLEYVFQLERASTGMIHFQGVIRYPNPVANWPNIQAHWERCRNWRAAVKYCTKVETRIDGPWTNIKGLIWRRTIKDPMDGLSWYAWEKELELELSHNPDPRKVIWIYEDTGNAGKSTFAKHLIMTKRAVLVGGKSQDAFMCISKYLEDKDLDLVIFDIPRSCYNSISYRVIEDVKNGMIFSPKYESNFVTFNTPHVIVFCNFYPVRDKLSDDRWDIRNIAKII